MAKQELARITASQSRRVIGVGALMGLGALMFYMGLSTQGMHFAWKATLCVLGVGALWASQIMWQATGHVLILTDDALTDSDGTLVARLDQIAKVDRGMFAMKPSNGFLVILKEPAPHVWRPGLWWRLGRRVAIGGVTSGSQTRPVADIMTHLLTEKAEKGE
jgi:hypothetical protein